jgi:hypothetical protein
LCHDAGVEDAVHQGLQQQLSVPVTTHKVQSLIKLNPAPLPSPRRVKGSASPSRSPPTPGSGWLSFPYPGAQQSRDPFSLPTQQKTTHTKLRPAKGTEILHRIFKGQAALSRAFGSHRLGNSRQCRVCAAAGCPMSWRPALPHPAASSNICRVSPPGPADRDLPKQECDRWAPPQQNESLRIAERRS